MSHSLQSPNPFNSMTNQLSSVCQNQSSPPPSAMAKTPPLPPSNIDIWAIRSECNRVFGNNTRHFNHLIFLFLSPISLTLVYFQIFRIKTLTPNLLCTLAISILSLFAVGSVTYSVFHAFQNQPVKLSSSIKAALSSFFPLLSTWLVTQLIISGIGFILGLLLFSLFKTPQLLGFQVHNSSPYSIFLCLVYITIFISIFVYLQVNWIFAYVIVVVESSWGFEPLKRSQILVKGMKGVAFRIVLVLSIFCWIGTWSSMLRLVDSADEKWENWKSLVHIIALPTSVNYMLFMFFNLSANTVFYMYSKAKHGDLGGQGVDLMSFDDGKVLD